MWFATLSILLLVAGVIVTWFVVIRPVMNSDHYQKMRAHGATVLEAFKRFRTMAVAKLLMVASFMVQAYDSLVIMLQTSGIDWTPLTSYLPPWAWPIIMFATSALFAWLRLKTTAAPAEPARMFSGKMRPTYEIEG